MVQQRVQPQDKGKAMPCPYHSSEFAIAFAATGGTSFRNADLTDADFTSATLKSTDFREATLTRTRWHQAKKLDRILGSLRGKGF